MSTTVKAALVYVAANAMSSTVVLTISAGAAGLLDVLNDGSPRLIAVAFALLGAAWRWWNFRLSPKSAAGGAFLSSVIAFIAGDAQLPVISSLFAGLRPESVPMLNGLVIGLFGLLVVTSVQDFIRAYARKSAEK